MFAEEAIRLLRQNWPDAQMLAEELYQLFRGLDANGLQAPLTVTKALDSTQPALQLKGYQPGDTLFSVLGAGGKKIGDFTFQDGGLTFNGQQVKATTVAGSNTCPGVVVSGTGSTYQVDIYKSGLGSAATRVTVTQLQIDPGQTIPSGTWAMVSKLADGYYMQVPVWL